MLRSCGSSGVGSYIIKTIDYNISGTSKTVDVGIAVLLLNGAPTRIELSIRRVIAAFGGSAFWGSLLS